MAAMLLYIADQSQADTGHKSGQIFSFFKFELMNKEVESCEENLCQQLSRGENVKKHFLSSLRAEPISNLTQHFVQLFLEF